MKELPGWKLRSDAWRRKNCWEWQEAVCPLKLRRIAITTSATFLRCRILIRMQNNARRRD